eukprot:SAG11_NODE_1230_length_5458_cov_7.158798_1_plen_528_part_00
MEQTNAARSVDGGRFQRTQEREKTVDLVGDSQRRVVATPPRNPRENNADPIDSQISDDDRTQQQSVSTMAESEWDGSPHSQHIVAAATNSEAQLTQNTEELLNAAFHTSQSVGNSRDPQISALMAQVEAQNRQVQSLTGLVTNMLPVMKQQAEASAKAAATSAAPRSAAEEANHRRAVKFEEEMQSLAALPEVTKRVKSANAQVFKTDEKLADAERLVKFLVDCIARFDAATADRQAVDPAVKDGMRIERNFGLQIKCVEDEERAKLNVELRSVYRTAQSEVLKLVQRAQQSNAAFYKREAEQILPRLDRDLDSVLQDSEFAAQHKSEALKRFEAKAEKAKDSRQVKENKRREEDEKKAAHTSTQQQRVHALELKEMNERTKVLGDLLAARDRVAGAYSRGGSAEDIAALETRVAKLLTLLTLEKAHHLKNVKAAAKPASSAKKPAAKPVAQKPTGKSKGKGQQQQQQKNQKGAGKGKGKGSSRVSGKSQGSASKGRGGGQTAAAANPKPKANAAAKPTAKKKRTKK